MPHGVCWSVGQSVSQSVSSRGLLGSDASSVVVEYQRFGGPCCLHLQGDNGIFIDVKSSNLA
jgi:hypothetical protein